MISVCIPVYNNYVNELVEALISQIETDRIKCEILLFDDGSDESVMTSNQQLTTRKEIHHIIAGKNRGRIEARKTLAGHAQYNWLLFIDSDSLIVQKDFLRCYINQCNNTNDVIVGGRIYDRNPPTVCNKVLHWKYGSKREKTEGRFIFMTNNFCIQKKLFEQIFFPNSLQGYGHEDTWIGIQLNKINARFIFINNPVLHASIEEAKIFIKKSEQALVNVMALEHLVSKKVLKDFIKLYKYYSYQQRFHFSWLILRVESLFHHCILRNLNSCNPNLWLFDFYRLAYFTRLQRKRSAEDVVVK